MLSFLPRPWMAMTAIACASLAASTARAMQVPAVIEGKSLLDASPQKIELADPARYTVVVFLPARCPCSASHEPLLAQLARDYGKEARFVGIQSLKWQIGRFQCIAGLAHRRMIGRPKNQPAAGHQQLFAAFLL